MNFWWGCNKVSNECTDCYIDALMRWQGKELFGTGRAEVPQVLDGFAEFLLVG